MPPPPLRGTSQVVQQTFSLTRGCWLSQTDLGDACLPVTCVPESVFHHSCVKGKLSLGEVDQACQHKWGRLIIFCHDQHSNPNFNDKHLQSDFKDTYLKSIPMENNKRAAGVGEIDFINRSVNLGAENR